MLSHCFRRSTSRHCAFLFFQWMLACCVPTLAHADVELPALFADGVILQRDTAICVWGRAERGERITVTLAERTSSTVADERGEWQLHLKPLSAGGPHVLTVDANNRLRIEDVWIGEVWIGAGQSNMEWPVWASNDYFCEKRSADLPLLRTFKERSVPASEPNWKGDGKWLVCEPETVCQFSGVLYFFGRRLHEELGVPVGLIESSVGGTPIQSWIPRDAQLAHPKLEASARAEEAAYEDLDVRNKLIYYRKIRDEWKAEVAKAKAEGRKPPKQPVSKAEHYWRQGGLGALFNGKIAPLIPFTVRGILWYQGEENVRPLWYQGDAPVPQAQLYAHHLPLLVEEWRALWGRNDLPFAWVQLPNFADGRPDADWPTVREAMRRTLRLPNTGMAIAIDVGNPTDIHPRDKRTIGERLSAWAFGEVYGRDVPAVSGPLFTGFERRGISLVASFDHAESGLVMHGRRLAGFELADSEGNWHPAAARIEGKRVAVWRKGIERPTGLRYAWLAEPRVTLFNGAGIPASPFTTARLDGRVE